jgi:hypothetical protein
MAVQVCVGVAKALGKERAEKAGAAPPRSLRWHGTLGRVIFALGISASMVGFWIEWNHEGIGWSTSLKLLLTAQAAALATAVLVLPRYQTKLQGGEVLLHGGEGSTAGGESRRRQEESRDGAAGTKEISVVHRKNADGMALIEEELRVLRTAAAKSLLLTDGTHKALFVCQLLFNGIIMSSASFNLPGKMLAGLALGNTVIKGLETHFKFEHTVESLKAALKVIKHLEHDFKHLQIDASLTHTEFEQFRREYDSAMKKLKAHM